MSQSTLSFDAADDRGTGIHLLALVIGTACTLCGLALLLFATSAERWLGIPLAAAGVGGVIWAFRALPQTKYYTYFAVDDSGIRYCNAPGSKEIFFSWKRVRNARALTPWKDDSIGIEITVTSTTGCPIPFSLGMQGDHVDQAMRVIQAKLVSDPASYGALESGRTEERTAQRER